MSRGIMVEEKNCRTAVLGAWYYVSTIGRDEKTIRKYIRAQEEETSGWINQQYLVNKPN